MANSCHRGDEDEREPAPATQHGSSSAACDEDTLKVFSSLLSGAPQRARSCRARCFCEEPSRRLSADLHFLRHVKSAEMMNSHGQDLIFTLLEFNFYLPYRHRRALIILQPDLATSQGRRCPGTWETCHI